MKALPEASVTADKEIEINNQNPKLHMGFERVDNKSSIQIEQNSPSKSNAMSELRVHNEKEEKEEKKEEIKEKKEDEEEKSQKRKVKIKKMKKKKGKNNRELNESQDSNDNQPTPEELAVKKQLAQFGFDEENDD